jgi:hypothetical protein
MHYRYWFTALIVLGSSAVHAQPGGMGAMGGAPIVTDLKKIPIGSWAEYRATFGPMTMKSRWAFIGRDKQNYTIEMSMEGGPLAMMGGAMVTKIVLVSDPATSTNPVKQMLIQMGNQDPMEMPVNSPNIPAQNFQKPDPKKLVGKETITVAAGSIKTSHYRDIGDQGTTDIWVNEDIAPTGLVKMQMVPKPGMKAPGGMPMPPVSMELVARGKGAKATIVKPPKPYNPGLLFGGGARKQGGVGAPTGAPPSTPQTPAAPTK